MREEEGVVEGDVDDDGVIESVDDGVIEGVCVLLSVTEGVPVVVTEIVLVGDVVGVPEPVPVGVPEPVSVAVPEGVGVALPLIDEDTEPEPESEPDLD